MKRFLRPIFHLLFALSLLLAAAITTLWTRSYWISDDITREARKLESLDWSWTFAHTGKGTLYLVRHTIHYFPGQMRGPSEIKWSWTREKPTPAFPQIASVNIATSSSEFAGIMHLKRNLPENYGTDICHWLAIPFAWPAAISTLPILIGLLTYHRARRKRGRNKTGQCPTCGYDIRATPDRCPECGMMLPPIRTESL